MNVLIVSEVGMFRHYMQRLVQQDGHDTHGVSCLSEFFDYLQSGRRIDLVITDWMFSGNTARELAAAAKKVTRLDDDGNAASDSFDYIILVTRRSNQEDRDYRRMLDSIHLLGIGEVIEKPFDRPRIQEAIRLVGARRASRPAAEAGQPARPERPVSKSSESPPPAAEIAARPAPTGIAVSPELLRGMLQHVPVGLLAASASGKIIECNAALCRIFGFPENSLRGQSLSRLIPSPHAERHDDYLAEFVRTGSSRVVGAARELVGRSMDGRLIPIELRVETVACGAEGYFVGVVQDITQRVESERSRSRMLDSFAAQNAELLRLSREADDANQAKSRFLANMSHEIRTPMTAIVGYADMLRNGMLSTEEQWEALKSICQSSEQLLTLVNNILDVSRIERGLTMTQISKIDLLPFVAETLAALRPQAESKGLTLTLEESEQASLPMSTDTTRLRQILVNLVDNAIKYSEAGGVVVAVRPASVNPERAAAEIIVRDTGPGIPQNDLEKLFRPFVRLEGGPRRCIAGAGLGLAISQECARLLGGEIAVQSMPGNGCAFRVTLPVDAAQTPRAVARATLEPLADPVPEPKRDALSGVRILLAEDGEVNRRLISAMLEKAGGDVTAAANGKIALSQAIEAEQAGRPFDLVLMDMQMPVMDGYQAVREMRQAGLELPIVALTALAMSNDQEKCLAAGCSAFLAKPIDRTALLTVIRSALPKIGERGSRQVSVDRESSNDRRLTNTLS